MSRDTAKDTDNPNSTASNDANTASKPQDSVTFALAQSHFWLVISLPTLKKCARLHYKPVSKALM